MYPKIKTDDFFKHITTERKARELVWKAKFNGKDFVCPKCRSKRYYPITKRAEVRQCVGCRHPVRLRAGTIFQSSKKGLLIWLKAIYLVTQGKRGISALELKRHLRLSSYHTAWIMLHKIREAMRQRDDQYQLQGTVEIDGTELGNRKSKNHGKILMAVEAKDWVDERGRVKKKAGFAKALAGEENSEDTAKLAQGIKPGTRTRTDGNPALRHMPGLINDYRKIPSRAHYEYTKVIDERLGWVHRLISNMKRWTQGTHQGRIQHLQPYASEYLFRFNRRHDPDSLFHRTLTACTQAEPKTHAALFG